MRIPAVAALLLLVLASPAGAADLQSSPARLTQPLADGCQRNAVGLLTNTTAHWTYVYRDNPGQQFQRVAEGVVGQTHVGAGDLPQAHDWYDLNFDLTAEPAYSYLTAGEPTLHIERESGNTPFFAYPSDGDHVKVWGNWIWDCGHWGPQDLTNKDFLLPGQGVYPLDGTSDVKDGESTEFHPWNGIVLIRSHPYLPQVQETEADVYITSNGTQAAAEAHCAKSNPPPPGVGMLAFYGPNYSACDVNPASRFQAVNDRDYNFFVPAPVKPSPEAHLRWRVVSSPGDGKAPTEVVTPRANGVDVTIPFKGYGSATEAQAYAKSIFVGWDGPTQNLPAHLDVAIKDIVVHQTLGEPNPKHQYAAGDPFGRYGLTMEVNGFWEYLNDWAPGLNLIPRNETTFPVNQTFGINVPDQQPVKLHVDGRECDLPKINPCPYTPEVADDNDDPGTARDDFASATAAVGDHTLRGINNNQLNYEIHYTVKLASPARLAAPADVAPVLGGPTNAQGQPLATTGTPTTSPNYPNTAPAGTGPQGTRPLSSGCPDTLAPQSHVVRVHVSRRLIRVVGVASDQACRGPGRVRSMAIAVGREIRGRCRFLRADGRLGPAASCLRTQYLLARGTAHWSYARRLNLPVGRYLIWSRAVDLAGNVEHKDRRRNLTRFHVH